MNCRIIFYLNISINRSTNDEFFRGIYSQALDGVVMCLEEVELLVLPDVPNSNLASFAGGDKTVMLGSVKDS